MGWSPDQGRVTEGLGDAMLIVPGGVAALRRQLLDGITADGWAEARGGFGDPELATE